MKPQYLKKSDLPALPAHSLRLLASGYPVLVKIGKEMKTIRSEKSGAVTRYRIG